MFSLTNFPFPPSENQIFKIINIKGIPRKAKSKKYVVFSNQVTAWAYQNTHQVNDVLTRIDQKKELAIYVYLYSPNKWYTKVGSIKKADAANYLKAAIDELCKLIRIDDSQFFEVQCRKIINLADNREYVNFVITEYNT